MPPSKAFRDRIPALGLVAALHALALLAFLHIAIVEPQTQAARHRESETQISLWRDPLPPKPPPKRRRGGGTAPAQGASNTITGPYFNPYTYHAAAPSGSIAGIAMALSACDPAKRELASDQIRAACDRIGMLLRNDPGRYGINSDVADPKHWQIEIARREAPFLAPCMSPNGLDVLYTLSCIYENLFIGYKPEHRRRYSE